MDRLAQTINLLTTPKSIQQIATLGATCYKLNSVQVGVYENMTLYGNYYKSFPSKVRYLLENYVGDMRQGESPTVGREIVEHVVALATMQADNNMLAEERDGQQQPQLAESNYLTLPFLLPQDGYVVGEWAVGVPEPEKERKCAAVSFSNWLFVQKNFAEFRRTWPPLLTHCSKEVRTSK